MASTTSTARRTNRTAARASRPPVYVEVTTGDGEPKVRRQKLRRPSRHTTTSAAIEASRLGGAWA